MNTTQVRILKATYSELAGVWESATLTCLWQRLQNRQEVYDLKKGGRFWGQWLGLTYALMGCCWSGNAGHGLARKRAFHMIALRSLFGSLVGPEMEAGAKIRGTWWLLTRSWSFRVGCRHCEAELYDPVCSGIVCLHFQSLKEGSDFLFLSEKSSLNWELNQVLQPVRGIILDGFL